MLKENHKSGHKAVFGIYSSKSSVEGAIEMLKNTGFRSADISVLMPTVESTKDFAHEKSTKAPEGAAMGATTGLILGGGLGWLAGIGSLAIPGLGPLLAAGPIVAALAGAGVVGALGELAGGLIGLGIPEYEAKRYEGYVREGGILLSVHVDDKNWTKKAKEILEVSGAHDIAVAGEKVVSSKSSAKITDSDKDLDQSQVF